MEDPSGIPVVLIAGPTASGKSAAAIRLANAPLFGCEGGEIVNADAMQVYRDLRTLTARPDEEEERAAPHHLYGVLDGAESCSAGRWARMAADVIAQIRARGRVPVVTGGTGLYFTALTEGLSPVPDVPQAIRAAASRLHEEIGPAAFRAALLERDPGMAHLPEGDRQRLIRAFEVHEATGMALSQWQQRPRERLVAGPFRAAVLAPGRETLYARCDLRLEKMLDAGALSELRDLLARRLDPALPVMKSLGVPEFAAHLAGKASLEEALAEAQMNTRRFAKRQLTWFRGQTPDWPVFADADSLCAYLVRP